MAKKKITFKQILKGILIGGGTVLSLLCPPVGGAVITAGMAIGAGAVAAGGLIKGNTPTLDNVTSTINTALGNAGLLEAADYKLQTNKSKAFVISTPVLIIGALIFALLIFRKKL